MSTADEQVSGSREASWQGIAESETFRDLTRQRHRLVAATAIGMLGWWAAFAVLISFFPRAARHEIHHGITLGYVLGLTQFLAVAVVTWIYVRTSDGKLLRLQQRLVDSQRGHSP